MSTFPPSDYRAETLLVSALSSEGGIKALAEICEHSPETAKAIGDKLKASYEGTDGRGLWNAFSGVASVWAPAALVVGIVEGGYDLAVYLYESYPAIEAKVGEYIDAALDLATGLGDYIAEAADSIEALLGETWDDAGDLIFDALEGLESAAESVGEFAEEIGEGLEENIEGAGESIRETIEESGIASGIEAIGSWFTEQGSAIESWISGADAEPSAEGESTGMNPSYESQFAGMTESEARADQDQQRAEQEERFAEWSASQEHDQDEYMSEGDSFDSFEEDWGEFDQDIPEEVPFEEFDFGEVDETAAWAEEETTEGEGWADEEIEGIF